MDMSSLFTLIGSYGFPVVCCIYLIYQQNKMQENYTQEIDKLRETVENNTNVMLKISAKMGVYDESK